MSDTMKNASNSAWDAIESEKKRDRFIRKVCTAAWTVTAVLGLVYAILVGIQVYELTLGALAGALPWMSVAGTVIPFVVSLGMFSVLVAAVSTIGMFMRMRTASLHEIQLRLAALEELLAAK
jgi:1,4-dihydroxy-2-naphthoate octaprenyltransferase